MGSEGVRARTARAALILFGFVLAACACLLLSPQTAHAQIIASPPGSCTADINGQTADGPYDTNFPIHVKEHTGVSVSMHLGAPVQRRVTYLSFGVGPRLTVGDETNPTSETTAVSVDKYATYGVGLYSVDSIATTAAGQCEVLTYVYVEGNPLTTVAGGVGAGLEAVSFIGLSAAAMSGADPGEAGMSPEEWRLEADRRERASLADDTYDESGFARDPWTAGTTQGSLRRLVAQPSVFAFCLIASLPALLLTGAAMAGGAGPSGVAANRLPRVHWRPYFSVVGMLSGIVGGAAAVVLLQQTGKMFPSYELLGRALVAGLLAGIVVPSLTRLIAVRRANRRIAAAELARSRRTSPPPPGAPTPPVP